MPAKAIEYTVSLPAPQTQNVEMTMVVPGVRAPTLDVALPVWRPGRYALIDAAGTVSNVRAAARSGQALPVKKVDKATWRIATLGATEVAVSYRVYANSIGDRTRHVDDTHAFLSPAAVFMYAPERRADAVRVAVKGPDGWDTATGMEPARGEPGAFVADNYDVLVDTPLEIGLHDRIGFDVDGVPHEIVIWHAGAAASPKPKYDAERMKKDFAAIVKAEAAIFGEMPYKRYVYLVHSGPGMGGGTEHLNSTIMQTSRASLEDSVDNGDAYKRFLGLVSHEMFHTWNVKQLRPADLKPYDYAHEDYTELLWVAEGSTSYYDDLCLVRAGLVKPDDYLSSLAGLIEGELARPGGKVQSLAESSLDAWIKFNKSWPDSVNTTVSFYTRGALVTLLLDMEVRGRTGGSKSFDDVMRAMYQRFPLQGPGYTTADLVGVLNEVSGSDFGEFFKDHVEGTAEPDMDAALRAVGLEYIFKPDKTEKAEGDDKVAPGDEPANGDDDLGRDAQQRAWIGLNLAEREGRTVVTSVLADGPAWRAGVMADDEIIALDGRRLRTADLDKRLKKHNAGDTVALTLVRRDELRTLEVTLDGRPAGKWTVRRLKDASERQKGGYASWLGQAWPDESGAKPAKGDKTPKERF